MISIDYQDDPLLIAYQLILLYAIHKGNGRRHISRYFPLQNQVRQF